MDRERTENGSRSRETIYYLSSVEKDEASYYASRIRAHWDIENKLHWHLDVTFREDICRVRAKNGAVNFSAMRKYALEMLKKKGDKLSLKRARNVSVTLTTYSRFLREVKSHASARAFFREPLPLRMAGNMRVISPYWARGHSGFPSSRCHGRTRL